MKTTSNSTIADVAKKLVDSDPRFASYQISDLVFRIHKNSEPLRPTDRLISISLQDNTLSLDCLHVKVQLEDICEVSVPVSRISSIARLANTLSEVPELQRFNHRQFIFSETEDGARLSLSFNILQHLTVSGQGEYDKLYARVFRKTIKIAVIDHIGHRHNYEITFASDDELTEFIRDSNGSGLVPLSTMSYKKLIRSFSHLEENKLYKIEKMGSNPSPFEALFLSESLVKQLETENSLIRYLKEAGNREIKIMPRVIYGYRISNNTLIELKQEWDACIYSYDTSILYVAECLTTDEPDGIDTRRTTLSEILLNPKTDEYKDLDITSIQILAAGRELINDALREALYKLGGSAQWPCGSRDVVSYKLHA